MMTCCAERQDLFLMAGQNPSDPQNWNPFMYSDLSGLLVKLYGQDGFHIATRLGDPPGCIPLKLGSGF